MTAGDGLTGGGTIASTRDFAVGAGTGIGVNANDIEVLGYSTISSNAKAAMGYMASGNEYSDAYNWYVASSSKISEFVASGDEYSAAYASAQALEAGAFKKVSSGWASIADNETIAHGLGGKPNHVSITPSGAVTFAVAFTCDATNITVRISAAGSRMVNWRAEL